MNAFFLKELERLISLPHVDCIRIDAFRKRIQKGELTKEDNPTDHFCSFFLPIHQSSKSIFLGHHIKANDWIPPGGHIERGETPVDTVYREFVEELNFKLTDEKVELFDLTIKHVSSPLRPCKLHYDFWHLVHMKDTVDFKFTKSEFYDARWMKINEAKKLMKLADFREVVLKVNKFSLLQLMFHHFSEDRHYRDDDDGNHGK